MCPIVFGFFSVIISVFIHVTAYITTLIVKQYSTALLYYILLIHSTDGHCSSISWQLQIMPLQTFAYKCTL